MIIHFISNVIWSTGKRHIGNGLFLLNQETNTQSVCYKEDERDKKEMEKIKSDKTEVLTCYYQVVKWKGMQLQEEGDKGKNGSTAFI